MAFTIRMDYAPIHEVLLSLLLFKRTQNLKYIHLGKDWEKNTRGYLSKKLVNELDELKDLSFFDLSMLFVEDCPDASTVNGFLEWLQSVSIGYMYERVQPFMIPHEHKLPNDLAKARDQYVHVMKAWYEEYFPSFGVDIFTQLNQNTVDQKTKQSTLSPEDLIDTLSHGWYKIDTSDIQTVHLVPQYHLQPFTTIGLYRTYMFMYYPMEVPSVQSTILNIAKALSDPIRLDIIQYLSSGEHTFPELIKKINSTKGNIHHHLMILRSCGLLRLHISEGYVVSKYSIRPNFMELLNQGVHSWLRRSI